MKHISEIPQNLLYFIYKKTYVCSSFLFTFCATLPSYLMYSCRHQYSFFVHTYIFLIHNLTYQIELYIAGALLVHKKRYLTVPFNCFLHTQILC